MSEAKISEFKSHLSAFVARARSGETIVILDRSTPVAQLGPLTEPRGALIVREGRGPVPPAPSRRRPRLSEAIDVVALLREDRDAR